ncbi:MAG TPA: hypothetical protein VJ842_14395 [Pyrinomonadaceae bacterium]|nr:hypothetical protein [Pyrinomonadaceae bacterium]
MAKRPRVELAYGQHRSLAHAERKRRALEAKHRAPVTITARRNARGHFSSRGQFYTFRIDRTPALIHWLITPKIYSGRIVIRTLPDYEAHAATLQRAKALVLTLIRRDHPWAIEKGKHAALSAVQLGASTRKSEFAHER